MDGILYHGDIRVSFDFPEFCYSPATVSFDHGNELSIDYRFSPRRSPRDYAGGHGHSGHGIKSFNYSIIDYRFAEALDGEPRGRAARAEADRLLCLLR